VLLIITRNFSTFGSQRVHRQTGHSGVGLVYHESISSTKVSHFYYQKAERRKDVTYGFYSGSPGFKFRHGG